MFQRLSALLLAVLLAIATPLANALTDCSTCTSFSIFPDTTRNFSSSVLLPPTYTDALVLLANASQTQAIPAGSSWVLFSGGCNFYAAMGASAAVPGATTTTGTAAIQNPAAWSLANGGTQITVVAASACIVTLSFYK